MSQAAKTKFKFDVTRMVREIQGTDHKNIDMDFWMDCVSVSGGRRLAESIFLPLDGDRIAQVSAGAHALVIKLYSKTAGEIKEFQFPLSSCKDMKVFDRSRTTVVLEGSMSLETRAKLKDYSLKVEAVLAQAAEFIDMHR